MSVKRALVPGKEGTSIYNYMAKIVPLKPCSRLLKPGSRLGERGRKTSRLHINSMRQQLYKYISGSHASSRPGKVSSRLSCKQALLNACKKLFRDAYTNCDHKLHNLIPRPICARSLVHNDLLVPNGQTDRFMIFFIIANSLKYIM